MKHLKTATNIKESRAFQITTFEINREENVTKIRSTKIVEIWKQYHQNDRKYKILVQCTAKIVP